MRKPTMLSIGLIAFCLVTYTISAGDSLGRAVTCFVQDVDFSNNHTNNITCRHYNTHILDTRLFLNGDGVVTAVFDYNDLTTWDAPAAADGFPTRMDFHLMVRFFDAEGKYITHISSNEFYCAVPVDSYGTLEGGPRIQLAVANNVARFQINPEYVRRIDIADIGVDCLQMTWPRW